MSANSIGKNLVLTSFGESHGALIGAVLDGFPSNFEVNLEALKIQLQRRKPGQSHLSTPRKEDDQVEIVSGVFQGKTLGTPITFLHVSLANIVEDQLIIGKLDYWHELVIIVAQARLKRFIFTWLKCNTKDQNMQKEIKFRAIIGCQ